MGRSNKCSEFDIVSRELFFPVLYQPLWLIREQIWNFMNFSGWCVFLPRANLLLSEEWLWCTSLVVSDLIPLFRLKLAGGLWPRRSFGKSSPRKQVHFRECPFLVPFYPIPAFASAGLYQEGKESMKFLPRIQNLKIIQYRSGLEV